MIMRHTPQHAVTTAIVKLRAAHAAARAAQASSAASAAALEAAANE